MVALALPELKEPTVEWIATSSLVRFVGRGRCYENQHLMFISCKIWEGKIRNQSKTRILLVLPSEWGMNGRLI